MCAGAAAGAVDSLATQGLKALPGGADPLSWGEFGKDFAGQVVVGAAFGAASQWSAARKGGTTFRKACPEIKAGITSAGWKSAGKKLVGRAVGGAIGGAFKGLLGRETRPSPPPPPGPGGRVVKPDGNIWNQYEDPQADAWEAPGTQGALAYAWR